VRSSDCACSGLGQHGIERDRHSELPEAFDDANRAVQTGLAKMCQSILDGTGVLEMQSEYVRFHVAFTRTQLDSGTYLHAQPRAGFASLGNSGRAVVISQRYGRKSGLCGGGDDSAGRENAVGRR
jgi:hypothetical protein